MSSWPIIKILLKLFGKRDNKGFSNKHKEYVLACINPLEECVENLTDKKLAAKAQKLKHRAIINNNRDSVLCEAFAVIREATIRVVKQRHSDEQLVAGIVLDRGEIAEVAADEKNMIVYYPAIFMAIIEGMKVHVVVLDDESAKKAAMFAGPVFELLGLTVGYVMSDMEEDERRSNYDKLVTYGSYQTLGLIYLSNSDKPLDFALIDEADSILIDKSLEHLQIVEPEHSVEDGNSIEGKTNEMHILAEITVGNYLKLYKKLAGMTLTAVDDANTYKEVYNCNVVPIDSQYPLNRIDYDDYVFLNTTDMYNGIVEEILQLRDRNRILIILLNDDSIADDFRARLKGPYETIYEDSAGNFFRVTHLGDSHSLIGQPESLDVLNVTIVPEKILLRCKDVHIAPCFYDLCRVPSNSKLKELGIEPHQMFPAKSIKCCLNCRGYDKDTNCQHCFKPQLDSDFPSVGRKQCREYVNCGLHIICVGRHRLRRFDEKLLKKLSVKGEPLSSRFFCSFDGELLQECFHSTSWVKKLSFLVGDGSPVHAKRLNKGIKKFQKKMQEYYMSQLKP